MSPEGGAVPGTAPLFFWQRDQPHRASGLSEPPGPQPSLPTARVADASRWSWTARNLLAGRCHSRSWQRLGAPRAS